MDGIEEKTTVKIPEDICAIARQFTAEKLTSKEARRSKEWKRQVEKIHKDYKRLATGLAYAIVIFRWADALQSSEVGRTLMEKSHRPTAFRCVYFLGEKFSSLENPEQDEYFVHIGFSSDGLFLEDGGRYAEHRRIIISSPVELATALETHVLETIYQAIKTGKVWEYIKKEFDYKEADYLKTRKP